MVKINLLTYLTFMLNSLVDRGYSMPIKEAKELCDSGTVIEDLQKKYPFKDTGFDFSLNTLCAIFFVS